MNNLIELISLLDDIPEGTYISICNTIKDLHDNTNVGHQEMNNLTDVILEIERLRKRLRGIRLCSNVTDMIKRHAIMSYVEDRGYTSIREYTYDALKEVEPNVNIWKLYRDYLTEWNRRVYDERRELNEQIRDLVSIRDDIIRLMTQ